jgi:CDGSH-type Zn-finger protein
MAANDSSADNRKRIEVQPDGPYRVYGDIPLVRKTQVVSEYGEPLTWQKGETITPPDGEYYELCRCGHSGDKPFCDCTHLEIDFDGTETAETTTTAERQDIYPGSTKIVVKRDMDLCIQSGFCGTRFAGIQDLVARTKDTQFRSLVIAMIERCPSGSLTYTLQKGTADNEPDLPQEIAIVTEITDDGPIAGELWVTGGIPIERADGQPFETRNRVVLCCCGRSTAKPLCDGTHRLPENG